MEKQLLEIKGYYSMNNKNEFIELNSWTGHILLKNDLSFEGIVVNAGTNDDRLIVGTVVNVKEEKIVIETSADQVRIEFAKWAISSNETAEAAAKAEAKKAQEAKAKAKAAKKAEK